METNKKVNEILDTNLVLAERLENRELEQTGTYIGLHFLKIYEPELTLGAARTVLLDTSNLISLSLINKSRATLPGSTASDTDKTRIYDNITVG